MTIENEAQIAAYFAHATGKTYVKAGGTRRKMPNDIDSVLDVSGLSGIELYDPASLTLIAKAGTPMHEIETALAQEGQMLAFEPMDHRHVQGTQGTPTLGGAIAGNISGPRRVTAGAARDFVLGLRFVTSEGHIVKNGGRVMKNVTGLDLSRFLTGSWGQLAVITQIALKVLPVAQETTTLIYDGLTVIQVRDLMTAALGTPYDVSGACAVIHEGGESKTYLRLEGLRDSVARRAEALGRHLQTDKRPEIHEDSAGIWQDLRDLRMLEGGGRDLWRIDTRPSQMPKLAQECSGTMVIDWAGGRIWSHTINPEGIEQTARETRSFFTNIAACESKIFAHADGANRALQERLQSQFDPAGRLLALA